MSRIMDNILDVNTKATAKRKLTISLEFTPDDNRQMVAVASTVKSALADTPGWDSQIKLPFEEAAVALQTRFQDGGDRDYTLQLLSSITTGAKVTYNDIGVATNVITAKGVALQAQEKIRPIVKLRPYRTFMEVDQPEGLFLIRIDERGITFTEADGGMWKLHARQAVAAWLMERLQAEVDEGDVVIML